MPESVSSVAAPPQTIFLTIRTFLFMHFTLRKSPFHAATNLPTPAPRPGAFKTAAECIPFHRIGCIECLHTGSLVCHPSKMTLNSSFADNTFRNHHIEDRQQPRKRAALPTETRQANQANQRQQLPLQRDFLTSLAHAVEPTFVPLRPGDARLPFVCSRKFPHMT